MAKLIGRLMILVLVVGTIGGGYLLYQNRVAATSTAVAASGLYTQVVQVKQGSLSSAVSVVGQLEASQSEDLAFSHLNGTAKLATLATSAGKAVSRGQVLATVDAAPYRQALDQAKSELQVAEKAIADLRTAATTLEIAQADVAVGRAQYQLAQARQDLADLQAPDLSTLTKAVQDAKDNLAQLGLSQALAERDSLAKSERDLQYNVNWYQRRIADLLDKVSHHQANLEESQELTDRQAKLTELQADLARVQAERQLARKASQAEMAKDQIVLAEAQKSLSDAQAGGDKLSLAKARLAIQDAEVSLAAAQETRAKLDQGADATDLAVAQANVDQKRLAVADAEAALAGTQLTASIDGTVLKTGAAVGDQIASGTTVVTVANLKTVRVAASVDETTIRRISAGQSAQITFDAFPGQMLKGLVQSVPLQGSLQGNVMVYQVPISLEGADNLSLLVGMTANVKIQVDQVQNALLVPSMALQKVGGLYQVLVPGTADMQGQSMVVPVEVGLSDGNYTQITKGLNAGDQVVVQMQSTSTQTSASSSMGPGMGPNLGGGPPPGE